VAELLDESKQKQGLIADVNHRLESDMVPLHKAVRTGNLETVKVLLKFFAEVNACDCEGKSPLHYAVQTGNVKMVQLMINAKVVVNHADEFGNTAMHTACNLMNI
jgi:ankyrin repeat protein